MTAFPFKGIVQKRPYPPTGLSTARWIVEVPTRPTAMHTLTLTQTGVRIGGLFGVKSAHAAADDFPHVVAYNGQLYLEDGHHRVVRAALTTLCRIMLMRVYEPAP